MMGTFKGIVEYTELATVFSRREDCEVKVDWNLRDREVVDRIGLESESSESENYL